MNTILLSGGSGKRLWPLSNEVRSKQFLKIFRRPDGAQESMLQRMFRIINDVDESASVTIAASRDQVPLVHIQLNGKVSISAEPCRMDTFPAISLATAYLHDVLGKQEDDVVAVCPVDQYVEEDYFRLLKKMVDYAGTSDANLVLMGIEPDEPSEKYGYLIPASDTEISDVIFFREKPDLKTAESYIRQGALWNGGVFVYRLKYVLDIVRNMIGTDTYEEISRRYESFPKLSFDYAVAEKEQRVKVMRFSGKWKDLGTWNALTEAMSTPVSGNAVVVDCDNTHVVNELRMPLIAIGLNNLAVAATPDGILVTEKSFSHRLKDYVASQRPMYERREWGEYRVLDCGSQENGNGFLTKHLTIIAGKSLPCQKHSMRTEIWTVAEGTGKLFLDGKTSFLSGGSVAYISPGMWHAIKATTEMHIIQVQMGEDLSEDDTERTDLDWEARDNGSAP